MPCTVYTCEDLWDRLVDTDYVVQVFEPMNAAILAFVLGAYTILLCLAAITLPPLPPLPRCSCDLFWQVLVQPAVLPA